MRLRACLFLALLLLVVNQICGQQFPGQNTPQTSPATLSDSSEDLHSQIVEILNAIKEKNSAKETELISSLLMPEDSNWFVDEYGPGFGNSLLASYRQARPELVQEIMAVYEANVGYGWTNPKILRYDDPEKTNSPIDHFLNSMNKIVPLYQTAFQGDRTGLRMKPIPSADGSKGMRLKIAAGDLDGYFAHVLGRFRFIPSEVMMKLPNERPVRVHLDMNVMRSKLIKQTYAPYPEEAARKHIGGKAVVRVDLGSSGNIQDIKPVEGDPILVRALLETVKQWKFLPTQLDGDPVEVEFDVEMVFQFN